MRKIAKVLEKPGKKCKKNNNFGRTQCPTAIFGTLYAPCGHF